MSNVTRDSISSEICGISDFLPLIHLTPERIYSSCDCLVGVSPEADMPRNFLSLGFASSVDTIQNESHAFDRIAGLMLIIRIKSIVCSCPHLVIVRDTTSGHTSCTIAGEEISSEVALNGNASARDTNRNLTRQCGTHRLNMQDFYAKWRQFTLEGLGHSSDSILRHAVDTTCCLESPGELATAKSIRKLFLLHYANRRLIPLSL